MAILGDVSVLVALTLANGFFSGSEIGLISVRKTQLQELADSGSRAARLALRLRADPERMLATVQVGITVVSATAAVFGGARLEEPLTALLERAGAGRAAKELAFVMVVALVSYLSIVLGELVPKSLALRSGQRVALIVARPITALAWLARPIVWLFTASANLLLKPFGDRTQFSETRLSREELQQLLDEAAIVGSIDASASEIASRSLDAGSLRMSAVMLPRTEIVSLSLDWPRERILEVMRTTPHARYPVATAEREEISGYVLAREVFETLLRGSDAKLDGLVRTMSVFPEHAAVLPSLKELQRARTHIALVVDELGGVAGLVTVEDIAEELVGEVVAEHEQPKRRVRREPDGSFVVDATLGIHVVSREIDHDLPEDPTWSTLAGLVVARAGAIPRTGDRVTIDSRLEAEVLEASHRRVISVRLRIREQRPAENDEP
jgi:putative hemolysin